MKKATRFLIPLILLISILFSACASETPPNNTPDTTQNTDINLEPTKDDTPYKHVLIIGVTSAGAFFEDTYTPNLDRIFKDGNITYECRAGVPTDTASCFTTLLHSIDYPAHKILSNTIPDTAYPSDSQYPSIFRAVLEANPDANVVSICRSDDINNSMIEDGINIEKITMDNDDLYVAETACEYVNQNGAPELMFVQFDFSDEMGHSDAPGFGGEEHLGAITRTDYLIDAIYRAYERQDVLDDTLIIVTSNHGGNGQDHGGNSDSEKNVMFAVKGKNVIKNGSAEDMDIRDVAPIVMYALGLESPEGWAGRLPKGIFEGVGGGERDFYENKDSDRYRKSSPTPAKGSDAYISNYIADKSLRYYLTFDGTIDDACGNLVEGAEDYSFVPGVFGQGIWLDNGNVTIPEYKADDAFTIAMWVKFDEILFESTVFTNMDESNPDSNDFTFRVQPMATKFGQSLASFSYIEDGSLVTKPFKLSSDYMDGWMHLMLTYSPEDGKVNVYFDFENVKSISFDAAESVFSGTGSLRIGDAISEDTTHAWGGVIDEFMQFDGSFTEEDIAALKAYYEN